jgi:hypothetical protein
VAHSEREPALQAAEARGGALRRSGRGVRAADFGERRQQKRNHLRQHGAQLRPRLLSNKLGLLAAGSGARRSLAARDSERAAGGRLVALEDLLRECAEQLDSDGCVAAARVSGGHGEGFGCEGLERRRAHGDRRQREAEPLARRRDPGPWYACSGWRSQLADELPHDTKDGGLGVLGQPVPLSAHLREEEVGTEVLHLFRGIGEEHLRIRRRGARARAHLTRLCEPGDGAVRVQRHAPVRPPTQVERQQRS